jgi:hypothetical protein
MRAIALLGLVALFGCDLTTVKAEDSVQPQLQSVIDDYLSTRRNAEHITGVALRVDVKGTVYDAYTGTNGRPDEHPIDQSTLFQIGSNTKHFTAALMMDMDDIILDRIAFGGVKEIQDIYSDSTLAIQESTLCRSGKGGQALSGNWVKSGGEVDITKLSSLLYRCNKALIWLPFSCCLGTGRTPKVEWKYFHITCPTALRA